MGYTKKQQPTKGAPIATIPGIALSGNPPEFIEAAPIGNTAEGSTNDGDNPSMPSAVPFANGTDGRNRPTTQGAEIPIHNQIGVPL